MVDVKVSLSYTALGNLEQITKFSGIEGTTGTAIANAAAIALFFIREASAGKTLIIRDRFTDSQVNMTSFFGKK